jgi:ABC-type multidrug transport system ATPase subunit
MSESILKALMQLFAIIARPDSDSGSRRPVVESFLKQQLNQELVEEYLIVYDNFYHEHQKKQSQKSKIKSHIASSSVRVLTICTLINKELALKQKIIVLIRLLEFINSEKDTTEQELEFVFTVADIFRIEPEEYKKLQTFVLESYETIPKLDTVLLIDDKPASKEDFHKHLTINSFDGQILVNHIEFANLYIFVYHGNDELYLNGQMLHRHTVYVLSTGSAIRDQKRSPIYYSDIVSAYNNDDSRSRVVFEVNNLSYRFKNGVYGLHSCDFVQRSGQLVGIMGASGSGKSTLLSILNGSLAPYTGQVLINGINVHNEKHKIEGIIGHVSQDDLLIEELSVFQNLYFNAKLCFSNYSEKRLLVTVIRMLKSLGLYEIKDMKVGSPLNKAISGGQRKRLNIALELIREPAVLFLDEPTSGLSSSDSENILDLLKELTLKGKLVFVVIHQPSSNIFKMFDKLLITDNGGYLIYNGNPVESIVYFKSKIKQATWNSADCPVCGNVNPEQVFHIVESKVLDEYGNLTQTRKTSPKEWNLYFKRNIAGDERKNILVQKLPEISFKIPNRLKQFYIFVQRDFLSKLSNMQYMIINLLEAPILAFLLAYIIKYYNIASDNENGYTLEKNSNLAVYIFMGVIIAIFIGLSISAQEIIKDRMILKRESFLNLSRSSYLYSKIFILFMISAYQSFIFVFIGNTILEIREMYFDYWLIVFATWCFSVLLGLNISDAFKTSITTYIVIPFLIIPQIVLSGIIVKYDRLNPAISIPGKIPWFGEIITARWSYEALAVNQFKNNLYEQPIFNYERIKRIANYKKDLWLKELENRLGSFEQHREAKEYQLQIKNDFELIRNELLSESKEPQTIPLKVNLENLYAEKITEKDIQDLKNYFKDIRRYYIERFTRADALEEKKVNKQLNTDSARSEYVRLKQHYNNENIADFVLNSDEQKKYIVYKNRIYQKSDPVYQYPKTFLKAHFYSPMKKIFGEYYETFYVNMFVIWIYTIGMYFTLYFSALKKTLDFGEYLNWFFRKRKDTIIE